MNGADAKGNPLKNGKIVVTYMNENTKTIVVYVNFEQDDTHLHKVMEVVYTRRKWFKQQRI